MKFIAWSNKDAIQVRIIDEQHANFLKIVDGLHSTIGTTRDNEAQSLLDQLIAEVKNHFNTEEIFMTGNKFSGYISHKLEHDRFYNKINQFRNSVQAKKEMVNLEFLNSLKRWYYNHIEMSDRKLGQYLNTIGIK
ncbi:MAG: bacteriohemerythrin [bacterium]